MENTRFHKGEERNFKYFAKDLAKNCDFFVNDAFSVAHRSHASVTGLTDYVPSFSGRSLEKEVITIGKFLSSKNKRKIAIIGGSKISTKINLINNLSKNVNAIVIGGAMANTFLLAQGRKIGKSLNEKSMVKIAKKIISNASKNKCKIILPVDAIVASNLREGGEFSEYSIEDIPNDQGGRVYITFERSIFDTDGLGRTEMYTIERLDGDQWVGLNSVGAYASNVYVVEATTLADSTSENDAITTYRVVANMDEGNFDSEPSSGYSVDNIFPGCTFFLVHDISDTCTKPSTNNSFISTKNP